MATYYYVVLTKAVPGMIDEFDRWYDGQHLGDCVRLPQIKSARRFKLIRGVLSGSLAASSDAQESPWDSLAIYEIESDDPMAVTNELSEMAGSAAMPMTEAFSPVGTVTMIATPAGSATPE